MIFILVSQGKIFSYSVSWCPTQTSQSFTAILFFQKMSNGKESSLQLPVLLQKWEMNPYIPLLSPEVKAFLPHNHVVSGNQRSGAGGQPGCCGLGSDKHNRSSGLTTTLPHPCSCPSPGCWNSLAKGMQSYFSASVLSNSTPMQSSQEQEDYKYRVGFFC